MEGWIDKLGIKHFRSIYSRDALPESIHKKECGIINLDDIEGQGTHWVCYRNLEKNLVEYLDPFGLIMPYEIHGYLSTSGKKIIYSQDEIQIEKLFYVVIGACIISLRDKKERVFWMLFIMKDFMKTTAIL